MYSNIAILRSQRINWVCSLSRGVYRIVTAERDDGRYTWKLSDHKLYGAVETVSSKQQPWLSCVHHSPGHLCYNLVHTSRIFKDEFIGVLLQPCLQWTSVMDIHGCSRYWEQGAVEFWTLNWTLNSLHTWLLQGLGKVADERTERIRELNKRVEGNKMLYYEHDMTIVFMNSQQLWLPA